MTTRKVAKYNSSGDETENGYLVFYEDFVELEREFAAANSRITEQDVLLNRIRDLFPRLRMSTPLPDVVAAALRAKEEAERLYYELIYAVGNKYEGESRHETALRYIKNAENQRSGPEAADAALAKQKEVE